MTALDLYALCPCGNGKKIKFCKCRDSVSDLEQVTQMIQGGQIVPALDRLSKIIKSHPDAAWALSLRGQLLMETGEKEALTENSDRFLRLQPSNPIALTQRAAAALFQGEVDSAIDYLLEALAESGQETDRMLISFAGALADVLFNVERPLTARVYATLALLAGESDFARQQLSQMNQSRRISLLLKSVPPPLPRPADAAWGERFDEARGLLQSNKIKLAETKLASLNRSHPGEPAIVSGLLTCAIWIGNTQDQSKYLRMLSEAELLDMEQRARYLAMACFVNPQDYFSLNVSVLRGEVENVDETEAALDANSRLARLPDATRTQLASASGEEVPPKVAYQCLDRPSPDQETPITGDTMPDAIGLILLYGNQTDQPAHVRVNEVLGQNQDSVRATLKDSLPGIELETIESFPTSALSGVLVPPTFLDPTRTVEGSINPIAISESRLPERALSLQLPLLGGKSLREVADDDSLLMERTAIVRAFESIGDVSRNSDTASNALATGAGIEPLPLLTITEDETEEVANFDLNRVLPDGLDTDSMSFVLTRSLQVGADRAVNRFANAILSQPKEEQTPEIRLMAYNGLLAQAATPDKVRPLMDKALEAATDAGTDVTGLLLRYIDMMLMMRDGEGVQSLVSEFYNRYGTDPQRMGALQNYLMSRGLIRPDEASSPMVAPSAPTSSAGGLWTPDGGSAPAPTPASSAPEPADGGGKLWLPGMD